MSLLQTLARGAYSTLLRLGTPLYLARLWWRARREPLYADFIGERLGDAPPQVAGRWVWVHAVSLGESLAAAPLVAALRADPRYRTAGLRLLLTHGTATGREAGASLLREGDRQAWLPYDTAGATRRFMAAYQPLVGVLMETEVWPNLLHAAQRAHVPMVLANARLSERSQKKGARLPALFLPAMQSLRAVLAQTEADAARLRAAGASTVQVMGNVKFDLQPDPLLIAQGRRWRAQLGRPVVLAAVSREGEESPLLATWTAQVSHLMSQAPGHGAARPLLLIVPRHPQRFDEVAGLVAALRLGLQRRSSWGQQPPSLALDADVWLGDSLREMPLYYGMADVALLGGSFAPLGGQNLIEAAACGCPLVMGPHTFNFALAAELAIEAGAARRVASVREGVQQALQMLQDGSGAASAAHATEFAATHRGASARMAAAIFAAVPRLGQR